MTDETRLNELLDLVEQARSEGDSVTEQKAAAAYKRESAPEMSDADIKKEASRMSTVGALTSLGYPTANTLVDTVESVKQWPGAVGSAAKQWGKSLSWNPLKNAQTSVAGLANIVGGMAQQPVNLLSKDPSNPAFTIPQFESGKPVSDMIGAAMLPVGGAIGGASKDIGGVTGIDPHRIEAGINTALLAAPLAKGMKGGARTPKTGEVKPALPTREQLKTDSTAAYKVIEDSGAKISEQSLTKLKTDVAASLKKKGIDPDNNPSATNALNRVLKTNGDISFQELETLRQVANNAEKDTAITRPSDSFFAGEIVDHIDRYMESIKQPDVTGGDPAVLTGMLNEARGLWARNKKTEVIDDLLHKAEIDAPGYGNAGMENAIRNQFKALAKNKRRMRGFSAEETAAIENIAKGGSNWQRSMRMIGKLAPTGAISWTLNGGAGFALGGPAGMVALPAVGIVAKTAAKKMAINNVMRAQELMRRGPPQQPAAAPIAQQPAAVSGQLMPRTPLALPAPTMIAGERGAPGTQFARENMGFTPDVERAGGLHPGMARESVKPFTTPEMPIALPYREAPRMLTDQRPMVVDSTGRATPSPQALIDYLNKMGLNGLRNIRQPSVNPLQTRGLLDMIEETNPAILMPKPKATKSAAKMTELQKLEAEAQRKGFFEKENPTKEQIAAEREWSARYKAAQERAKNQGVQ